MEEVLAGAARWAAALIETVAVLGLEFQLAADIVRSVTSPAWTDIGQLAAIAAIRTFLNYFLEHDLERAGRPEEA